MRKYKSSSATRPNEWDLTSSPTTKYHNINIKERETEQGIMFDYEVEEYENDEYFVKSIEDNKLLNSVTFVTLAQNGLIDDVTICEHPYLFQKWDENFRTNKSNVVVIGDDGMLYSNIHPIIDETQNIEPTKDKSQMMWQRKGNPNESHPQWVQPLGSEDCYMKGDKVSDEGSKWISNVDDNIWKPCVYGWDEDKS